MENCILCGEVLTEGKCTTDHSFKKMCLNCSSIKKNEDGKFVCCNETLLADAVNKVTAALPSGYTFDASTIKPIPLKKPTARCGNWALSDDAIELLKTMFV